MTFLVMNIGCIECGEASFVVGVFSTHSMAMQACKKLNHHPQATWTSGEHRFEVFGLPELDIVTSDDRPYSEYLV